MGADGGSIPDRRDLVRTKGKALKTDKEVQRERFFTCALSKKPLTKPIVADPLGKLYNKDAILEYLIDHSAYGDGEMICPYVKGVKDLLTLNAMPNPSAGEGAKAPFVCWLSLKEMNGAVPFIALRGCGCVFSDAAVRAVVPHLARPLGMPGTGTGKEERSDDAADKEVACPNCGKAFDATSPGSVMPISPPQEVQDLLLETLVTLRAAQKANKKRKKDKADVKADDGAAEEKEVKPAKAARKDKGPGSDKERSASGSPAPGRSSAPGGSHSVGRSVQEKLAEQEKRRIAAQANMSDAVKSIFRKTEPGQKPSDVNDFFGRTFNRYAA